MEKLLPIKFFEKRKIDEQLTEAGGSKDLPKWVMQGEALQKRVEHLSSSMVQISAGFESHKAEPHELPMVMATTITEKAIAKSHRGSVVDLLNSDSQSNVIGVESLPSKHIKDSKKEDSESDSKTEEQETETRRLLSLVTSDELIANINRALKDAQGNAKLISTISDIELFQPQSGVYNPENMVYRVRLIDYQDRHRNQLAQTLFKNKCATNNIIIEKETRYSADMRMYRISLDSADSMELVRDFEGIFSIEEAIPIHVDLDAFDDESILAVKASKDGVVYPTIGVLDSGINKNTYLSPWILSESEEYYEDSLLDKSHGSMVASVLEYSDELNGTDYLSTDGVMMLEAAIAPDLRRETVYPEDLIDNVRDAIERHRDIKIWTMSVGTTEESLTDSFSEYGMALDNIADENGVLIIKSAGNSTAFARNGGPERIAKMADSVRSLVVGSIAGEKSRYDMAEIDMPSPFTRCGPGPLYIIKPDLVAYGGNAGICPDGKLTTTGVKVFDKNGSPSRAPGTSFSTPWVARIAAELNFLLDGDFDPLLIKALMIHNAGYPIGNRMKMEDKKKFMGFGMPAGTRNILYNSENEITLILRDTLPKGNFIDILDFPFSDSMIGDDGMYHGQIILTMVSKPILKASEGPEYCQSDIKVAFGTMDAIKERDTSKKTIRNPYGAENSANLMRDDFYSKKVFDVLETESFGRERTLLNLGSKFHPIKKYAIDLDELTKGNKAKFLGANRKWYMKVETLFRDAVEREARDKGEVLEQDFCILVTLRDPSGKAPVYNEVTQQLQEKNFVYSNVQLKNEIREHVRIEEENNG
jgi:hypothetical protein